jgi:cytoskeleton protein RodZ
LTGLAVVLTIHPSGFFARSVTVTFGVSLKRERELRGISLAEIAKTTKISVRLLEAIEKDRFDILPEGVFRKSFIKSYAKYLGMNEEQILHEYDLEVQPSATSQSAAEKPSVSFRDSPAGSNRALLLTSGVLLLLVAVGSGFWYFTRANHKRQVALPAAQPPAVSQTPASRPAGEAIVPPVSTAAPIQATSTVSPPAATTGSARHASPVADPAALKVLGELAKKPEPVPVATEGSAPLELTVEANSQAWLSVSAGETALFSGILNASEAKKFSLETPLKVTLGNAGGVRLQVNGQVFPSLGKPGERKTLEISAANYQQYLTAKKP